MSEAFYSYFICALAQNSFQNGETLLPSLLPLFIYPHALSFSKHYPKAFSKPIFITKIYKKTHREMYAYAIRKRYKAWIRFTIVIQLQHRRIIIDARH